MKQRLDSFLLRAGLASSRHQAEVLISLGKVKVNGRIVTRNGTLVEPKTKVTLLPTPIYVSRAAYKLAPVVPKLSLSFTSKVVLDVGASKGGFTDVALQAGATKVYAVDVGTAQLDKTLLVNPKVVAMEKTDVRNLKVLPELVDVILADLSFVSLRVILPYLNKFLAAGGQLVVMAKPQFEVGSRQAAAKLLNKGVVKNDKIRRRILTDFEVWAKGHYRILGKADSALAGEHGNVERFYLLAPI